MKSYPVAYNLPPSEQFSRWTTEAAQQQVVHATTVKYKMCVLPNALLLSLTLAAVDV